MTEYIEQDAADAKSQADAIIHDKESPYWQSGHRQHRETVDRVMELMSQVHGDAPAYVQGPAGSETADFTEQITDIMAAPNDPDVYDFSNIQLSEGEEWDADGEQMARSWMYQLGIGEAEGEAFVQRFDEFRKMDDDAKERMPEESELTLRRHWGQEFDANIAMAREVVGDIGPEFSAFLEETGLANDHAVALTLHRIAVANGY